MVHISRSVQRLSSRECDQRREQLRADQLRWQIARRQKLQKAMRRRDRIETAQGVALLAAIIAIFALVYWLAISDAVPNAF